MRFAPMFCDGESGGNPESSLMSQNLKHLRREHSH
jgi:hypothetical protein